MVLQSDFPPDMRVQKEAVSLVQAGYRVTLLCDNRIPKDRKQKLHGINIVRMQHIPGLNGKIHRILNVPIYPNPIWINAIKKTARQINADVLHVHDLPLAFSTIKVAKSLQIPVVFDLHENYPAAMDLWHQSGLARWTIRNPNIARYLEKKCLTKADSIIVIAEEHKEYLEAYGVEGEKIYIVENTPYRSLAQNHRINANSTTFDKKKTLLYFGKINPERNLEIALKALPAIQNKVPDCKLLVVGDGPALPFIKEEANRLGLNKSVEFTGWINLDKAIPHLKNCDICIMPHGSNDFLDLGVPNKLFEYMAMGKPVVIPDSKASARVVREANCGTIFKPDSVESFADATIKALLSDKEQLGNNGKNLILKKYNWEKTEESLLELYSKI